MKKPTSTSEVQKLLQESNISIHLAEPPREFIAVLSKEGETRTASVKFQHPGTNENQMGTSMVIHHLLTHGLEIPVILAEYEPSTLDWVLDEKFKDGVTHIKIPGDQIRYTLEKQKRGSHSWKYLDKSISLQIFASDPFLLDQDEKTLEANLSLAKSALETEIEAQTAKITAAEAQREKLTQQLALLQ